MVIVSTQTTLLLIISQVGERIFISGQIGLIASSLTLPSPRSLALETALSFQHVDRVMRVLKSNSGGGWEGNLQAVLCWLTDFRNLTHVKKGYACNKVGSLHDLKFWVS